MVIADFVYLQSPFKKGFGNNGFSKKSVLLYAVFEYNRTCISRVHRGLARINDILPRKLFLPCCRIFNLCIIEFLFALLFFV